MKKWTELEIIIESNKYSSRSEFQKFSNNAYQSAYRKGILDKICQHMPLDNKSGNVSNNRKWNLNSLKVEASKYKSKSEFWDKNSSAYVTACKMGMIDLIAGHMLSSGQSSRPEQELTEEIKKYFINTKKHRAVKVSIPKSPNIKRLDIDIFVPELNKGIEFDGRYWHSKEGLKRGRPHWTSTDLDNYENIKDSYFKSLGIEIFHVKEEKWRSNKNQCILECLRFLGIK